jgi:hypothetical protein
MRGKRIKKAGTALVLTAAVTLGGIAFAAPAQAAELGRVSADANWSAGWKACRAKYPATRSIRDVNDFQRPERSSTPWGEERTQTLWRCYDTPNAR